METTHESSKQTLCSAIKETLKAGMAPEAVICDVEAGHAARICEPPEGARKPDEYRRK